MKRNMTIAAVAATCLMLGACATTSSKVPGVLYTKTAHGEAVTEVEAGSKVGTACANSILGAIATGDASIEAARKNGRISKISQVDAETSSILGFYSTYCTVVRGN